MSNQVYGKILDVDLSTGVIKKSEVDPQFAREYLGGMGFSNKILYDEIGPEVDPLSPDNIVIFAPGTFAGSYIPSSGRMEITNKHPYTGSIGTGNTGGFSGVALKHAGYEMLIVRNKAEKPVYLWINDDAVEIRDASHLWGKDANETTDIIQNELPYKVPVIAIGQAGENLVPFACPTTEYHHGANRTGAGAVMGSKRLKALAVRGSNPPEPARPRELQEAISELNQRRAESRKAMRMPGSYTGGGGAMKRYLEEGGLRVKNYQSGFMPTLMERLGPEIARKYVTGRETGCKYLQAGFVPQVLDTEGGEIKYLTGKEAELRCDICPSPCFDYAELKDGKYAGTITGRPGFVGLACAFGTNVAIDNLPAIWKCKELCQRYGLDYVPASGTIAFAMELFQRGIITKGDADGLDLSWGNEDATIELLRKISFREGFGEVLAEGTVKAAERIGKGAERYAMTLKNVEVMCGDPRAHQKLYVLCDITNPRGGDNIKGGHNATDPDTYDPNWWVDKFDMFEDVKRKIFKTSPQEITSTWEGKPLMTMWVQDLYSLQNALGINMNGRLDVGPNILSRLYSAYTGWDTSPEEMMKYGEKVFNLFKAYCVRQGQSRKDDNWPDRFYDEPVADGPKKGAILSRETIDKVLDEYYEVRGWDRETGIPTREKLEELGLKEIAEDLAKHGKLP